MDKGEHSNMVTTEKELKELKKADRKELIQKVGKKVADRNEEGLKKVSKN
ncbi:hypothetical protein [Salibacterium sp. K-3]